MDNLGKYGRRVRTWRSFLGICWIVVAFGCGDTIEPDDAITIKVECAKDLPCASSQLCIANRCVDPCTSDEGCGRSEMCVEGRCVPSDVPPPEVSVPDQESGPCAGKNCNMTPTRPVCHPNTGECEECVSADDCDAEEVCNFAKGTCQAAAASICAACDDDADCGEIGKCVTLEFERVCLPDCMADGCDDRGLTCQEAACRPMNVSCTEFRATLQQQACVLDTDCTPFGTQAAAELCQGVCATACVMPEDCPTGMNCTEMHCVAP